MVDPIIGMKQLTKVLMDGGSGLNIMYAETLDAMGIDRARIRLTGAPFHGIVLGKQVVPLGSICPSPSGVHPTTGQRPSPSKWLSSTELTTPS